MTPTQLRRVTLMLLVTVAAVAGGFLTARLLNDPGARAPEIEGFLWPRPKRLAAFELDASDGGLLDPSRLSGRWTFLFFGYTHCPDVCPGTLSVMATAMKALQAEREGSDVQVVFVSVDPGRDSLDHLRAYVSHFDSGFIAATADDERLARFTRALGVVYLHGEADAEGRYDVDHTASLLLVDPQLRLVGLLSAPHEPGDVVARFKAIRERVERAS